MSSGSMPGPMAPTSPSLKGHSVESQSYFRLTVFCPDSGLQRVGFKVNFQCCCLQLIFQPLLPVSPFPLKGSSQPFLSILAPDTRCRNPQTRRPALDCRCFCSTQGKKSNTGPFFTLGHDLFILQFLHLINDCVRWLASGLKAVTEDR